MIIKNRYPLIIVQKLRIIKLFADMIEINNRNFRIESLRQF